MVHVGALPGTPHHRHPLDKITRDAVAEARILDAAGFDAVMLENMHDRPYVLPPHGPETTAAMTRIALAVRAALPGMPMGVQILAGGEREAMAVAAAAGAQFIRCENFVFSHIADEGLAAQAAAGPLLRYRREIGAENIAIFADIDKKHASHALTADISLTDEVEAAELFGADGVIVTGTVTGKPTDPAHISEVRAATKLPLLVGSGVTAPQVKPLFEAGADALIVGSALKQGGLWSNSLDPDRCREIVSARR
jgi:membrane complex biogenesis BtpA family protein